MPRILVTGGAGFIGSHVVDGLIAAGHEVVVLDDLSRGSREYVNPRATFLDFNLADPDLARVIAEVSPQQCFHLAAQVDVRRSCEDPIGDAQQNIVATLALIEATLRVGLEYFCFASSGGAIYGEARAPQDESHPEVPINPYGVAKLAIDKYLHTYRLQRQLRCSSMRLANVYGPRQSNRGGAGVVAVFSQRLQAGEPLVVHGDGEQTRDFLFAPDLARAAVTLADTRRQGTFNFGSGVETSINELARTLLAATGRCSTVVHGPAPAGEQRRSVLNGDAAWRELGWRPTTPLAQGLAQTYAWFAHS